jgi:hypothetical protein
MDPTNTTLQMRQHAEIGKTTKDTTSHPGTSQSSGMAAEAEAFDLPGSQVPVISDDPQDGQVSCAQRLPDRGQAPPPDTE